MIVRRLLSIIHGPVFGGGHNQIIQLRGPLLDRGFETIAVVPHFPGNARQRLLDAGVDVEDLRLHRLRAVKDPRVQGRFVAAFGPEVAALRRLIRRRDIDVVQVHGPTNPHGAVAARVAGVAVVWQLYDTVAPMALRRAAMPLVTRLADVITTTGRGLAAEHPGAHRLGDRCVPYYPPVDTRRFSPDPARRTRAREELGVGAGDLLVGAVGNRNPTKGFEHLARAAGRLRAAHPRLRVRVLGAASPVHASYEARIRAETAALSLEATDFEFSDPGDRVSELMPAFDVFALTSVPRSEGVPTVILEAMACGLPVLATDVGAVREAVEHERTGLVVAPEDDDAIAAGLGRLLADPVLRERLGAAGRKAALERFALERCADVHAHAYELALSHRAARRPSLGSRGS